MTRGDGDGLVFDAEVRRGGFTLAVSLTAACGEVLGLLGPNGAGKSTLLGAVAGLTPVSAGRITLAGQVLDDADAGAFVEASGRPVGFVFQNYRLFPYLTVAENVAFSPRARGQGRRAARSAASHWLDRLGRHLAGRKPGQLSGGQAQRVALARALAGQPELLLLDEPLSALDAGTRLDVQAELKRHLADFTGPCLLVTHDALEALVLADRLLVLEGGRIAQDGTPAQIARQPATDYVAKLVGLNLYAGQADGSQVKLTGGGAFVVADTGQHRDVLVAVRPSAVVVSTERPQHGSARNTWPAKITGLTLLADRVRLDLEGQPSALVDVTPAAVAELSLRPGSEVWLTAKATDLEVYPRADRRAGWAYRPARQETGNLRAARCRWGWRRATGPLTPPARAPRHATATPAVTGGAMSRGGRHDQCAGPDPHATGVRRGGVLQQPGDLGDALRRRAGWRPGDARGAVPVRGDGDGGRGRLRPDDGPAGGGAAASGAGPGQRPGQPAQRPAGPHAAAGSGRRSRHLAQATRLAAGIGHRRPGPGGVGCGRAQ
jgi:molybdate transport system ATP-binding protein